MSSIPFAPLASSPSVPRSVIVGTIVQVGFESAKQSNLDGQSWNCVYDTALLTRVFKNNFFLLLLLPKNRVWKKSVLVVRHRQTCQHSNVVGPSTIWMTRCCGQFLTNLVRSTVNNWNSVIRNIPRFGFPLLLVLMTQASAASSLSSLQSGGAMVAQKQGHRPRVTSVSWPDPVLWDYTKQNHQEGSHLV